MKKIAVTLGDPNGISPEITIKALNLLDINPKNIILIANKNILNYYEKNFSLALKTQYDILDIPFDIDSITIGKDSAEGGEFAFQALIEACKLVANKEVKSIVTAPISKNAIKKAGHDFAGQTEILEKYIGQNNQKAEMVFVSDKFNLMLITRHIALSEVNKYINKNILVERIGKFVVSLKKQLNIKMPKIAVCALNPHAGENGMFGDEEQKEIIPAINELKESGVNIEGPFAADSLFARCAKDNMKYNSYIAMYHDQGLIPMKLIAGDNCVNTTLGLDVLRTSPAHGVAYDIAGLNIANPTSMVKSIQLAEQ